jgi:uncharacterized protein YacL (UPF0231 family)
MSYQNLTSIKLLKTRAKELKSELGIQHQRALDAASEESGFNSYHHARKAILNTPHKILYGVDIKDYFNAEQRGVLKSFGFTERQDYCNACYELAMQTLGEDSEIWRDVNDWIAVEAEPTSVTSIKEAAMYGLKAFTFEPIFLLFDGIVIELDELEYQGKKILSIDGDDDFEYEDEFSLPSCLVEDFDL